MGRTVARTVFGFGLPLAVCGTILTGVGALTNCPPLLWGSGPAALGYLCIAISIRASSGQGGR